MPLYLPQLSEHSVTFPDPRTALQEPEGLLAFGGDLSVERMVSAYRQGIFPWFSEQDPLLWWSPDPRAVLPPGEFHVSRSMARFHRMSRYTVTLNQDFLSVIQGCATQRTEGTWITEQVIDAWQKLFYAGLAHSVEVWEGDQLVGGLYGMAVGQLFCAESMFSRVENASKTALMKFCPYFSDHGGRLIDCQILNPHTASLGVKDIPRDHYLQLLSTLRDKPLQSDCWQPGELI